MPFFHLPKPLYEVMPQIYLVGGLAAAIWSDNVIGLLSGVALAVAGLHVRALRRQHRQKHAAQRALMDARLRRARQSRAG